jgi:hypothetical protein
MGASGWAGPWPAGRITWGKKGRRGEELGWAMREWAGGLCVCLILAHGG